VPTVPTGPEHCVKDTTYTFTTIATDPDGDSVAVRFDWGDSTPSYWQGWFASGDTVALAHAWCDTGTYEVHAWAQDQKLLTSDLSGGLMVRVALRRPPNAPAEPTGPDSGGQDSAYEFGTSASHPDGISVAIRFAWGDGYISDWSSFIPPGGPVRMSHAWSAPGTYAVTAQAKDTGGLTSPWSSPHHVIIRPLVESRLRMVGHPALTPDRSGFRIYVVNDGTTEITIGSLEFFDTPESAYMRSFYINGNPGYGYPRLPGQPGTGPGDTAYFAPLTIMPDDMVEVLLVDFYVDRAGVLTRANVHGKTFRCRFSDGSDIIVEP